MLSTVPSTSGYDGGTELLETHETASRLRLPPTFTRNLSMLVSYSRMVFLVLFAAVLVPTIHAENPTSQKAEQQATATELFDGKSLAGWDSHLDDENAKTADVWSVRDGVLVCKGQPMGYLYTTKQYENFKLKLQWRWPEGKEPGNSGVLLRISGEPHGFLVKCAEAQLKHGNAGDVWGFYGFHVSGDRNRIREVKDHKDLGNFAGVAHSINAEKEPGQWNTYEIKLIDDDLTVKINGELVNQATDLDVTPGYIGLQSEGTEIEFRNIELTVVEKS